MVALPTAKPLANPAELTVARDVLPDAQVIVPKVAAVPSVMMPLAVNCCVLPINTLGAVGVMEMEANTGTVTVKVALLEVMPFVEAVTVVLPCASVEAMPLAFSVATVTLLDAQVTDPDTLPELPSK